MLVHTERPWQKDKQDTLLEFIQCPCGDSVQWIAPVDAEKENERNFGVRIREVVFGCSALLLASFDIHRFLHPLPISSQSRQPPLTLLTTKKVSLCINIKPLNLLMEFLSSGFLQDVYILSQG